MHSQEETAPSRINLKGQRLTTDTSNSWLISRTTAQESYSSGTRVRVTTASRERYSHILDNRLPPNRWAWNRHTCSPTRS